MSVTHIQQPAGSALCGHSCIAMVLGISLDDSIKLVGHRHGVRNHEIIRALGGRCETKRSVSYRSGSTIPDPSIIRVKGQKSRHHVALYSGGQVYDPAFAKEAPSLSEWIKFVEEQVRFRIVSVFPLLAEGSRS